MSKLKVPRPEYPRPQSARPTLSQPDWLCLNGEWQFEIDHQDDGLERGLLERDLNSRIMVPFCPESILSGIENTSFMNAVWYRRQVTIPKRWKNKRILLHFQAVDYDATVWVNDEQVGRHRGGFTPFTCDLGDLASAGQTIAIVVRARDDHQQPQARGKQSQRPENYSCFYTRTTGIWQTVWLEPVPKRYMLRPRLTPDASKGLIRLQQPISNPRSGEHLLTGYQLHATVLDGDGLVCEGSCPADAGMLPQLDLAIPEDRRRYWAPGEPALYDVEISLLDRKGKAVDRLASYAGLRDITLDSPAVKINGKPVFQRLVLDQGYFPDGIMTAPDDAALKADIEMAMAAGFNGARLHQKIFEERFLYHADHLGYMVWGEFPDWGSQGYGPPEDHQRQDVSYLTQWLEALQRDYSHPCIVGWCPLNETWQPLTDRITNLDEVTRAMFLAAKTADGTRPVLDASGYAHRVPETDVYDCHDYEQNPELFAAHHARLSQGKPFVNTWEGKDISLPYHGQPFFVSEFGGIWWSPGARPGEDSWGYGERPAAIDDFYQRFSALCGTLLDNPRMFGYCYTQLTDVFQEQNGIYTFDRKPKFDLELLHKIQGRRAAVE